MGFGEFVDLDFAEFAHIADSLALERVEVRGDSAVLEVHQTGEGLVEERADRVDGEVTGFGLSLSVDDEGRNRGDVRPECGSWP